MKILTAPFYSLFSVSFYRRVLAAPLSKGFLYLAYLSGIATLVFLIFFMMRVQPEVGRFFDWVRAEIPELVWTPKGLSMKADSPFVMTHPEFGPLVTIDTTKSEMALQDMGEARMFVTSSRVYVREGEGMGDEVRVYNITALDRADAADAAVVINSETLQPIQKKVMSAITVAVAALTFPFFYLWKLIAAVFYSLPGMVLNQFRAVKLNYPAILNVSIFALTPVIIIQFIELGLGSLIRLPLGPFGAFLVTAIYLFIGIKKTETSSE